MRIALTGSQGFVGSALKSYLGAKDHEVQVISWERPSILNSADVVIHAAGLAHRIAGRRPTQDEFDRSNYFLTVEIARAARSAGVRRFVFISSIAVIAGNSGVLYPDMNSHPIGPYAASKAKAEEALLAMSDMDVKIIRPPLVYGPDAKGNMGSLIRLAMSPLPLPFGAVRNRRTLVSIGNLISAIEFVSTKNIDATILHTTDARPVSLQEIITSMRAGAGRRPGLLPIPPTLMAQSLKMIGMKRIASQLFDDLEVDGSALEAAGWQRADSPDQALQLIGRVHAGSHEEDVAIPRGET